MPLLSINICVGPLGITCVPSPNGCNAGLKISLRNWRSIWSNDGSPSSCTNPAAEAVNVKTSKNSKINILLIMSDDFPLFLLIVIPRPVYRKKHTLSD
jgi:hypothetical protein